MPRRDPRPATAGRSHPVQDAAPDSDRATWIAAAAAFAISFAVYAVTVHPDVPGPDSGEMICVARVLGVAHPPGYPLYTLLAHGFAAVMPVGAYAWRINLMSALATAAAVAMVCATACRLTGMMAAGLTAALALAFARPIWRGALVAEAFPLNDLMAALLLFAFATLLRDAGLLARRGGATPGRTWPLAVLVLVSAAIPAQHHSLLILAVPLDLVALALLLLPPQRLERWWPGYRRPYALGAAHVTAGIGLALLGLAPLLQLPLAAARRHALVWGSPDTLPRFLALLARSEYGSLDLAPLAGSQVSNTSHAALYLGSIPGHFAWAGAALAAAGAVALSAAALRGRARPAARPLAAVLLGAGILQLLFFSRIHLSADVPYRRGVVERFYALPDLGIALLVGFGAAVLLSLVPSSRRRNAGLALAVLAGAAPLLAHFRTLDQRGNHFIADVAHNVLASLPRDAVLFTTGDILFGGLTYRTVVAGERPDVTILDQYLMTRAWYVREVRRSHPGLLPAFTTSADPDSDFYADTPMSRNLTWIDHLRGRRPVAFVGVIDPSFGERYDMVRRGLVTMPTLRGELAGTAERTQAALDLLPALRFDSYFRPQDPVSPETRIRPQVTQFLASLCFLLCEPEGLALRAPDHPGFATLSAFLDRFEPIQPTPDAEMSRAAGFLHAFHPDFLDRGRAVQALDRYLATGATGPEADGASRLLGELRRQP